MISTTDKKRVQSLLGQLGCNDREVDIYLESLLRGPSSIQELARAMKVHRVTVHSAVELLIDKGLMTETRKGKRRLIVAREPEHLHQIIQKKENELQVMRANVDYVSQLLDQVQKGDGSRPTVKFYEGADGFKYMLEETLKTKGEVLVFTYVDLFSKVLGPDYLEDYFVRRAAKGIHTRLIFPPCSFADRVNKKAEKYRIQVRLLSEELTWKSGIFAWDDTIALMSYTEGKFTTTFIENADIAQFYRVVLFEMCWQQAQPMTT